MRACCSLYGQRRPVRPVAGTRLASICGAEPFDGFHFCGYGRAQEYAEKLAGSGTSTKSPSLPSRPLRADHPGRPSLRRMLTGRDRPRPVQPSPHHAVAIADTHTGHRATVDAGVPQMRTRSRPSRQAQVGLARRVALILETASSSARRGNASAAHQLATE